MALEIIRIGRYRARFASSEIDVSAAQSLRYKCFNLSNKVELDVDEFDIPCRHVLVENLESKKLICCYRIMIFDNGKEISNSYSSQFYDLKAIESFPDPMIEVGRFCVQPEIMIQVLYLLRGLHWHKLLTKTRHSFFLVVLHLKALKRKSILIVLHCCAIDI